MQSALRSLSEENTALRAQLVARPVSDAPAQPTPSRAASRLSGAEAAAGPGAPRANGTLSSLPLSEQEELSALRAEAAALRAEVATLRSTGEQSRRAHEVLVREN